MARQSGSRGARASVWARVATIIGLVWVTVLAFAAPALADDGDGSSGDGAGDSHLVAGTPCTDSARACVDLKTQKAWLIDDDGKVARGPVPISSGGPRKETPVGAFDVQWKDKNHKSQEFKLKNGQGAPMPFSVFFADGGVAFHGGSVARASAGCVHLNDADAVAFYNTLELGDEVQVHKS